MPELRVAIVGPESSGKTTLVGNLADWLRDRAVACVVVAEQGRLLAERLPAGHPWSYREQLATSRAHRGAQAMAEVELLAHHESGVVLCDGSPATPAVWHLCAIRHRPGYDAGPVAVTEELLAAADDPFDVVLLLQPDLPWQPDGIRDDPDGRQEAFGLYRQIYPDAVVIGGVDRARQAIAVLAAQLTGA